MVSSPLEHTIYGTQHIPLKCTCVRHIYALSCACPQLIGSLNLNNDDNKAAVSNGFFWLFQLNARLEIIAPTRRQIVSRIRRKYRVGLNDLHSA